MKKICKKHSDWLKILLDVTDGKGVDILIDMLSGDYVNKNMELEEFKFIFWWEWFHRFFARLIGIVFITLGIY